MQENYISIESNGYIQIVPSQRYRQQRLLEVMTADAKILLSWLKKRQKQVISVAEMQKCAPIHLRKVTKIRQLMDELIKFGFAEKINSKVIYSGRITKQVYRVTQLI